MIRAGKLQLPAVQGLVPEQENPRLSRKLEGSRVSGQTRTVQFLGISAAATWTRGNPTAKKALKPAQISCLHDRFRFVRIWEFQESASATIGMSRDMASHTLAAVHVECKGNPEHACVTARILGFNESADGLNSEALDGVRDNQ